MSIEDITVNDFNTADVEDRGIFFFKAGSPAEKVEKAEFDSKGNKIEGTEYEAIQMFLVANQKAIYDQNRNLTGIEDTNAAINVTFKLGHPEKTKRDNAITQLKSWWMVNFGAYPPNDGKTFDWDAIMANLHDGPGAWGSINHFKVSDEKIVAYVGNRFSKEPPKKGLKEE